MLSCRVEIAIRTMGRLPVRHVEALSYYPAIRMLPDTVERGVVHNDRRKETANRP